ncbi:MAG: exo-alpha-sialidase [Isosphaeraceae bacterium]|nr:exo-alpha-sialidase [Isosphaeraceae bacterium]
MATLHTTRTLRALALVVAGAIMGAAPAESEGTSALIKAEFVFTEAPFASCHASTIAETPGGLVAAWFGGTDEGKPDVGIWVARRDAQGWSRPVEVAEGRQEGGQRFPCWNPVLFQTENGPLQLFYKVGPSPKAWWGLLMNSADSGRSWSPPKRLPDGILGPIKNKPVRLPDGALLCPSSTEDDGWRVHLERTTDAGATWTKTAPAADGTTFGVIQPSVLFHPGNRLQILCRSQQGRIVESWSEDGGATWGPLTATGLPNPNSGTDAVTLKDGRALLVYNHTRRGRSPLNVALSEDGKAWKAGPVLETEPGEFSYPAVIQGADDRVHVVYTWKRRRIKHVVLDPAKLVPCELRE